MSNRYRNPFKIRATEKLESENNFLRMYSPYVLDELIEKNKSGKLWNNVLFIRSSPGAGKTSMLKVLEPLSLLTLSNNRSAPYYKDIIEYLKNLEILDGSGHIKLTGVYMSCARNYEVLEDLDISEGQKKNLFFALINARIILATLRSLIVLNGNVELEEVLLDASSFDYSYLDLSFPLTGVQLFEYAANIEKSVFKAIDSFVPITDLVTGHSELFALDLMKPENFKVKGQPTNLRILFMFDDAHKLSNTQRQAFIDYLTVKRSENNIWIAERLEALDEYRNFGSYKDRDYDEINLEQIWQGTNKLKTIVGSVAEKRASMSSEDVKSFQDFLVDDINESEYEDKFIEVANQSLNNIKSISKYTSKFDYWLIYLEDQYSKLTPLVFANLCRQTEIIVHRNVGKAQLTFEFPLTIEELNQKLGGEIQVTATYLMAIENKIPYYYGFDNLVKLASNNIEQFLGFAAELFEIMIAQKVSGKPPNIEAKEQERMLKKVADNKWKEQSRLIPEFVLRFIQNLAQFCQKETNKPNAPYAPGVNGFSIKESNEHKLIDNLPWREDSTYKPLTETLRICLSYNLLERRITKQGKENQQWTVYYLNRWVCLRFNLPFSFGGFRHKTPGELLKWIK